MIRYMDTSAFVKHYGKPESEKGVDIIDSLFGEALNSNTVLVSSIFMIGEAASVFDRWVRIKIITSKEFEKIWGRFLLDVKELGEKGSLILETVNPLFITFSIEFIIKHHISINDAIHLYTALSWTPGIDEFVCSDENLIRAAENEGLEILNPEAST